MSISGGTQHDATLLERVRQSDPEAFRTLFERYQPILFRSVLISTNDADAAHDIVQETFVRVWDHRASLQTHLSLLAYLYRISKNLIRDMLKHSEVRRRLEGKVPPPLQSADENPDESLQARILEEKVAEVVGTKLPPKCREVFLLSRMEGMSNSEISGILGITVKTVENQITRALKILRKHLRGYTGLQG